MTLNTPDELVSQTTELLQSLQASVRRVRQQADLLCRNLQAGEDSEMTEFTRRIASVEGLIRTCQKVEANLVEQLQFQSGFVQGGHAIDLDGARTEIGSRLARLRPGKDEGEVPE